MAVLGCHVLGTRFQAVNSFPLMSHKTVYPAVTKHHPWTLPALPIEPNGREFTLSELIPGTPVYFSKHRVPTPAHLIWRQLKDAPVLKPPPGFSLFFSSSFSPKFRLFFFFFFLAFTSDLRFGEGEILLKGSFFFSPPSWVFSLLFLKIAFFFKF